MFASNLKFLRERAGLDQQQFAKLVHRGVSTVSEWESGKYTPKAGILADIANYFGVRLDDMMGKDLSASSEESIDKTVAVMKQLRPARQKVVYQYAKAQLDEQNEPELLAAHLDHELTTDERDQVDAFISKIRQEQDKKE